MKTGMSMGEFMAVARRAEELKRDYETETRKIHAVYGGNGHGMGLHLESTNQTYRIGPVAHDNLATLTGIPRQYYGRMLQAHPKELTNLVEMHLHEDEGVPQERFVRTIGSKVRALLSTRYGVLDHIQVAEMLINNLPTVGMEVRSVLCTERRLTFQFLMPRVQGEVRVGEFVQAGLAASNSEVGLGMYRLEALLFKLACTNGLIVPSRGDWKLERIHRGNPNLRELASYTQDRLLALPEEFNRKIVMARNADGVYVPEEELARTVDRVRRDHALTLAESERVLDSFYQEGRWTGWGLSQAVNFQAHSTEDHDRSVELERISGQVLEQYF